MTETPTAQRSSTLAQSADWRWLHWTLTIVLVGAFALRLTELTRQNIWWDEARNIDVALRSLWQIPNAPELDIHPPVYFLLLHTWLRIAGAAAGDAPTLLAFLSRFLSICAGVVSVALLAPLARRAGGAWAVFTAVLLGAASPFWLAESQEARMYTVGFALLMAAAIAWFRYAQNVQEPETTKTGHSLQSETNPQTRPLIAFVIFSTLALLTHYNVVFVLVAWYVGWGVWALLDRDRWRRLRTLLLCGLAMTVLAAPVAPIALRQIPGYTNPNLNAPTAGDYLWQNWQGYLGGYAFDPNLLTGYGRQWLWLALAVTLLGVMGGFVAAWRPQQPAMRQMLYFLLVWLLGSLGLYYIAVLDRGAFNIRYASFITPALYLLIGAGVALWRRLGVAAGIAALLIVAAGIAPAVHADLYDARLNREDMAGVTAWLVANAGPDDLVLVDQKYPFGFYYQRYSIAADATPFGPEAASARYLFVDINTIDQRLNQWAADVRRVFWVQWFESDTDPRHAVSFLLDQAGDHAGEEQFQGYSIDWWTLNPPNHFELAASLQPQIVTFLPAMQTVAVATPDAPVTAGRPLSVVIRWQRGAGDINRPLKARVALYDASGARLAQADERLLNDRHLAPAEWAPDDQPLNVYSLHTPADLPAGAYELKLLVYDAETLEPLSIADSAGNPAGVETTIGTALIAGR